MADTDVSDLLTVEQAIAILDAAPVSPRTEQRRLPDALGLRLAADIVADRDYPPFDKSVVDGYAVRCADVRQTPVQLTLAGEVSAGQMPPAPLEAGQAMAVMTGAPLPPGADGVVPLEETQVVDGAVRIQRAHYADRYVARRGSDMEAGRIVLPRGTRLDAAQIAVAATVGAATVEVFARPRVAVLSTGDELVPLDAVPAPAQIRGSNNLMLAAMLRALGCEPVDLGTMRDDPQVIGAALRKGMEQDAVCVTGGMSMGRYDHVPRLLREMGVQMPVTKLRIKPGKPFVYGFTATCHIFGLPGNPVSAFVCMARLASRLLTRLAGGTVRDRWVAGQLSTGLAANGAREFYQPVQLQYASRMAGQTGIIVHPLMWKGSADVFTLASADGLLIRAAGEPPLPKNSVVRVLEL